MPEYLDRFRGTLRKRQADQVLKLLNKQKNSGQIRTIQEFTTRLDSLIRELNQSVLIPTLKLYEAEKNNLVDSDTLNFMLERVEDDLSSSFEEAVTIDEVQKSHEAIVRDVILKNLKFGIAELESKVALYKFLNSDTNGFDTALFSTFRESKEERASKSIEQSTTVFSDPRTGLVVDEPGDIDVIGERLTLSNTQKTYHTIKNVRQIFDQEAPQGSLIVEPPNVSLANLIDGRQGTFWVQTLLFQEDRSSVKVKIEIELAGTQNISFLEVEPISRFGTILESVQYADGANTLVTIISPNRALQSTASFFFRTVTTKRLVLTFRNENSTPTQFEYGDTDNLFNQAFSEPPGGAEPSLANIEEDLDLILDSAEVKSIIGVNPPPKRKFRGFAFTTGFDNIRVGTATFSSISSYVSRSMSIGDLGQTGLRTLETRPVSDTVSSAPTITEETYDTDDDLFFHSSIEYWVVKRDFDENGNILGTIKFPILPMGVERVHHERLLLTSKSDEDNIFNDLGQTVFFTDRVLGNVRIWRNGVEIQYPAEWTDETTSTDKTPNTGSPMAFKVKIGTVSIGDLYTISYNPMTSSTPSIPTAIAPYSSSGATVVDMMGDLSIRLQKNQTILVDRTIRTETSAIVEVFLQIIIRSNTANTGLSAAVEEYILALSERNSDKFGGFGV